ncbi:MAG: hypothetical protein WC374_01090 [Phycisphaerae bacterium]|jgi:preprotein translocase subunit Sec61beta
MLYGGIFDNLFGEPVEVPDPQQPGLTTSNAISIGEDTVINPGDTVRFTFTVSNNSAISYVERNLIKARLEDIYPQLRVLGDYLNGSRYTILCRMLYQEEMPIELQDEAGPLVVGLVLASIVAGGLLLYYNLDKIEKITDSPAGQAALFGAGAAGIAIAVIVIIILIGQVKR